MASGLKYWLGAVLVGMALVAVMLLPVGSRLGPEPPIVLRPERDRFLTLKTELTVERERLERMVWLDSVAALLGSTEDAPSLIVGAPESLPAAQVAGLEQRLRDELADLGGQQVSLGVFMIQFPNSPPPPDEPRWSDISHDEYYVGQAGEQPYCFLVRHTRQGSRQGPLGGWEGERSVVGIAGSCAYAVRYGMPGPAVSTWLKEGSLSRGKWRSVPAEYLERAEYGPNGLKHLIPSRKWHLSLSAHGCLEGDIELCNEIFLRPASAVFQNYRGKALAEAIPELWASYLTDPPSDNHLRVIEPVMLADLEREFGTERFSRFWTSDEEVEAAFEDAFGVGAGAWMQRWARGYLQVERASLRAGVTNWTATLLALIASLLVVIRSADRRRIG